VKKKNLKMRMRSLLMDIHNSCWSCWNYYTRKRMMNIYNKMKRRRRKMKNTNILTSWSWS
jgi:hypothetical protein